jgi:CDP-glucose 4,6-dehydratase
MFHCSLWSYVDKDREKMKGDASFEKPLAGKKVFVTGNTGFTGGWACLWLKAIGADVAGYALAPDTTPSLFIATGLDRDMSTTFGDICDYQQLHQAIDRFQPDLILHLAAQPLVRRSYKEPTRTFEVNTQGTAHVLDAARSVKSVKGVLCITTDKVYKNNEWSWPYRENDPLGGKDPYSASKSAAEMVIQSFAASFPHDQGQGPAIATARGGNIIGGGDWSEDRLIPDFVRAITQDQSITLRYPDATRPWQHVLALVHGYLMILAGLISEDPEKVAKAWNLGPQELKQYSVRDVLELMASHWRRPSLEYMQQPLPEAQALALDSSMARNRLGWLPCWDTEQVVRETAAWYRDYYAHPEQAREITLGQIQAWRDGIAQ